MAKKKSSNGVRKHEEQYIHISKRSLELLFGFFLILSALANFCVFMYLSFNEVISGWSKHFFAFNVIGTSAVILWIACWLISEE